MKIVHACCRNFWITGEYKVASESLQNATPAPPMLDGTNNLMFIPLNLSFNACMYLFKIKSGMVLVVLNPGLHIRIP